MKIPVLSNSCRFETKDCVARSNHASPLSAEARVQAVSFGQFPLPTGRVSLPGYPVPTALQIVRTFRTKVREFSQFRFPRDWTSNLATVDVNEGLGKLSKSRNFALYPRSFIAMNAADSVQAFDLGAQRSRFLHIRHVCDRFDSNRCCRAASRDALSWSGMSRTLRS